MAIYEIHTDSDPLVTGTHKGANEATTLYDPDALFATVGVIEGLAIHKTAESTAVYLTDGDGNIITDGDGNGITIGGETANEDQNSLVSSATDVTVEASGITWLYGDTYSIYKTGVKDSFISKIGVDKSRGWKAERKDLNSYGWRPEDTDIDKDSNGKRLPKYKRPFTRGEPRKMR